MQTMSMSYIIHIFYKDHQCVYIKYPAANNNINNSPVIYQLNKHFFKAKIIA